MALMSNAMHVMGLFGVPRRTAEPQYEGFEFVASFGSITELRMQLALGATLLFISTVLFVVNIALSTGSPTQPGLGQPLPKPLSPAADSPEVLDNLKLWFGIAMVLVVLAYALPLTSIVGDSGIIDRGVSAAPVMIDLLTGLNPVAAVTDTGSRLGVAIWEGML